MVRGDANGRFEIGSVPKVFTSTLLAGRARRGGHRGAHRPVSRWLPPATPAMDGLAGVTLQSLASLRSGLARLPPGALRASLCPGGPRDPYADLDEETLLASLARTKVRSTPGRPRVRYSHDAAGLLGHLLGRAAGSHDRTALTQRVLQPLVPGRRRPRGADPCRRNPGSAQRGAPRHQRAYRCDRARRRSPRRAGSRRRSTACAGQQTAPRSGG